MLGSGLSGLTQMLHSACPIRAADIDMGTKAVTRTVLDLIG